MATLLELRRRVRSVKNIGQITRAVKLVAGAKLRRAQDSMLAARPYSEKMWDVLGELAGSWEDGAGEHPLLQVRREQHITAVVVTSDRGLCGGFNGNAIKYAHRALEVWSDREVNVVTVGRKSWDHFRKQPWEADQADEDLLKNLSYPRAAAAAQYLIEEFVSGNTDAVYVIYNEFVSPLRQNLVVEPLLPLRDLPFDADAGKSFRQAARAFAELRTGGQVEEGFGAIGALATELGGGAQAARDLQAANRTAVEIVDYIFEPSAQAIIHELLPRFVEAQLYQALLESSAAEHAARMAAMDNATKNAEELIEDLTLTMNKLRQEAITTEILEVVGGAEALR